jgi:hypothetical protein
MIFEIGYECKKKGWETSQRAFGMRKWQERWKGVIGEVIDGREQA